MQNTFYCFVKGELKTAEQNKTTVAGKHFISVNSFFLYLNNIKLPFSLSQLKQNKIKQDPSFFI